MALLRRIFVYFAKSQKEQRPENHVFSCFYKFVKKVFWSKVAKMRQNTIYCDFVLDKALYIW